MKFLLKILPAVPYIIVFILSFYTPSDPDLGWHLKYGEYFWQHGTVLRDNTFSTMMPDYHWGNTSWFTDVISYTAYHLGGFVGLMLMGSIVVTATFYFFAKASRLTLWHQAFIFPLLLYIEQPINSVSFRGQQLSLLLVGVMLYLISFYKEKPKLLWLAIPLFCIWANVHGEFILGFVVFGVWVGLYIFQKLILNVTAKRRDKTARESFRMNLLDNYRGVKKETGILFLILVASFLVTFINPFGYVLNIDAASHIGSPLLKDIAEYLPFEMYSSAWWIEVFVGTLIVIGLAVLYFKNVLWERLPFLGGGLLLYILSTEVRRFAWPAFYLLMPLLTMVALYFKPDSKKMTNIASAVLIIGVLIASIASRLPLSAYTSYTWDTYCQTNNLGCSPKSAEFLIDHHLTHDLYTLYGWGGWLIWKYPQIKPSIDGRMHLWEQNGYSAFAEYYDLEQDMKDIDKTKYNVVYISTDKPVYARLMTLTSQKKWKEVYADKSAAIFVRND